MADDDSSDLSSLSSLSPAPSVVDGVELKPDNQGIMRFFSKVSADTAAEARKSPPPKKREPSPPHDFVFADNFDIAFIVMFRKRFDSVMPRSLAHFGPIEFEQDILQDPPAERVEHFLCVILGLLLNRKQDIKIGHYHKALNEDAINGATFKSQWPKDWEESPLARGGTFHNLSPIRRLDLLKTLTMWALGHSEAIKGYINSSYTGKRTNDDLNQPLSVQPWGVDSDKRRYFLIEGDDNCSFRVYRESNPAALYNRQWISVAGSIPEVKALADKLSTADGGPNARKLSNNIMKNIANFEEKEEKRKRREYRRQQKERFRRPEPGFSMYEGRTRGKRVKYTYSDEEDFYTDSTANRRSTRNTRNPSPDTGPVVTASGRQSRPPPRMNGDGASNGGASAAPSVQGDVALDTEMSEAPEIGLSGRPRRSAAVHRGTNGWANSSRKRRKDFISDDEDDEESEPDFGDDEDDHVPQDESEDEEEFENDAMDEEEDAAGAAADSPGSSDSRVVKLHIKVKFDKNGKAKRMAATNGDTPSASTPSNVASSPSAALEESSDDMPSDIPNHDPERTEDVVNVVPLKQAGPGTPAATSPTTATTAEESSSNAKLQDQTTSSDAPSNPAPAEQPSVDLAATISTKPTPAIPTKSLTSEAKPPASILGPAENNVVKAPGTPLVGQPASLAFRGSPEKVQSNSAVTASPTRD